MPPVRWKFTIAVLTACLIQQITSIDSSRDTISMTSNGWRPIIGMGKDEITQYRNPSPINGNSETIHAVPIQTTETPTTPKTLPAPQPTQSPPNKPNHIIIHHGVKIPPHSKHHVVLVSSPNHGHGPHIPLNSGGPRTNGPPPRGSLMTKGPVHVTAGGKKLLKPIRGQLMGAHSMKNEVFIPAPTGHGGSYAFFTQNHGAIKTREIPNLGPKQHYHISQPHGHIEFISSNFPLPPGPMHGFLLPNRGPVYITHNDDYTRNLIPPPAFKPPLLHEAKEKRRDRPKGPEPSPTTNHLQVSPGKPLDHAPPPFPHDPSNFLGHFDKEQAIDVQVTKEKFNVFHNSVPPNYTPTTDHFVEPEHFTVNRQQLPRTELPVFNSFPKFSLPPQEEAEEKRPPATTSTPPTFEENTKRQSFIKFSDLPSYPTYEVTETKQWQPFYSTRTPSFPSPPRLERPQRLPEYDQPPKMKTPNRQQIEYYEQPPSRFTTNPAPPPRFVQDPPPFNVLEELAKEPFLPTPYEPDDRTNPTLATHGDVSSIYAEVGLKNKHKMEEYEHPFATFNPPTWNIKEVSTHYPVVGLAEAPTQFSAPGGQANAVTTEREDLPTEVTTVRPNNWQTQRTRTNQRRRRPQQRITTSTTESSFASESYEMQKVSTEEEVSREKPVRRRPNRYRSTTPSDSTKSDYGQFGDSTKSENVRFRDSTKSENVAYGDSTKTKKMRPTTTMPTRTRHRIRTRPTPSAESEEAPTNHKQVEDEVVYSGIGYVPQPEVDASSMEHGSVEGYVSPILENEVTDSSIQDEQPLDVDPYEFKKSEEMVEEPLTRKTTTEMTTTNLLTPENEIDYSTPASVRTSTSVVEVVVEETVPTTSTTSTTTTTEPPTTTLKSHRIRTRPIKYESKNRPRFSVKDYRQRHTTTETTKAAESTTLPTNRFRFPSKVRKSTTTTPSPSEVEAELTERGKFVPKEARTETSVVVEEKPVKVNTRLRPFSRYRTTTEASTSTQKVSVKPSIFSSLRRPTPPSLRNRILSRNKGKTSTTEKPEEVNDVAEEETTEVEEVTEASTEIVGRRPESGEGESATTGGDILKNDAVLHSQIVSDLTSSAKKEYDTPGLFKAVSPASRRVPSYFTLSTDDPILPIEAFFPSIKEKTSRVDVENEE